MPPSCCSEVFSGAFGLVNKSPFGGIYGTNKPGKKEKKKVENTLLRPSPHSFLSLLQSEELRKSPYNLFPCFLLLLLAKVKFVHFCMCGPLVVAAAAARSHSKSLLLRRDSWEKKKNRITGTYDLMAGEAIVYVYISSYCKSVLTCSRMLRLTGKRHTSAVTVLIHTLL